MADIEKVIKAIDICLGHGKCDDCGYRIKGGYSTMDCRKPMMRDALELLKEQEAKTGKWIPIESPTGVEAFGVKEMTVMNVRCSVCGSEEDVSFTGYKYCPRCGAKIED